VAVILSFVSAFLLVLVPLPDGANIYRPDWVVLVLIYWCLEMPDRVGPGVGWFVGLMADITQAHLLGLNALGMTVVGYLANRFQYRLRMFPWWQQAVSVFFLLLLYRALVGWIWGFVSPAYLGFGYWMPCVTGMLVWPLLFVILRSTRKASKAR
jgi:rod shape-determining protein MreD